jgi:S-DNA-T family DNA segregation ATPase FtsK/SpoIIIE
MNSKKILLPEPPVRSRDRGSQARKRKEPRKLRAKNNQKSSSFVRLNTHSRQRSEAIGLLVIGCSAFALSLLHYVKSSLSTPMVEAAIVNLGMGVYIIPILAGFLGIQKFMEKPFTNLGWRIAGCVSTSIVSLGLLRVEGGKLGISIFSLFSSFFGTIPSYLVLGTLLLTSLIFALDILYKDVLAGVLIITSLLTKLFLFTWELSLSLISMSIGAVKTTTNFIQAIIHRIKLSVQENSKNNEATELSNGSSKLLQFKKANEALTKDENILDNILDNIMVEPENISNIPKIQEEKPQNNGIQGQDEVEEATIITESENDLAFMASSISATLPSVTQAKLSGVSVQFVENPTVDIANTSLTLSSVTTPPPHSVETLANENKEELSIEIDFEDGYDDDDDLDILETVQDESGITSNQPTLTSFKDRVKSNEEPVYLEDNAIDKEIKTSELAQLTENLPPPKAEFLLPDPAQILKLPKAKDNTNIKIDLENRSQELLKTLEDFNIKASITEVVHGPAISRFELKPAPGVKVSKITGLSDDIALALSAQSIRIEAPIPGKPAIGIEIPNKEPTPVYFYDLVSTEKFIKSPVALNIALGQTINGQAVYADLADMPHLLIAGSTGSGKSVCVNTIIASILFRARPDEVKFIMVDPKMVELSSYNGIPHLISPVVTDPQKAGDALLWAQEEMTRRYSILAECGCKKIQSFNERIEELREEIDPDLEPMPLIVVVIDELADLMMTAKDKVETTICRLAQMARAVGIHLIIATQRPSVDVLTGLIKANLPTRIAFSVASAVDSKTILDSKGAEKLIGKGDMLFIPKGRNKPLRVQGAFVSDSELKKLVDFVKSQGEPEYLEICPSLNEDEDDEDITEDSLANSDADLIDKIINYLEAQEKTSTSMLQRKFRIGYNRAARIMDQLEERGMVTPTDGTNKRRVLIGRSVAQL